MWKIQFDTLLYIAHTPRNGVGEKKNEIKQEKKRNETKRIHVTWKRVYLSVNTAWLTTQSAVHTPFSVFRLIQNNSDEKPTRSRKKHENRWQKTLCVWGDV